MPVSMKEVFWIRIEHVGAVVGYDKMHDWNLD